MSTQAPSLLLQQRHRYRDEDPADQQILRDLEHKLDALNLVNTPVWCYDPERCQILWTNPPGLEIWKVANVAELRQRDIAATQSEAMYALSNDYLRRALRGESLAEWVTLEVDGSMRRVNHSYRALKLSDGRHALLIEGRLSPSAEEMLEFASNHTLTIGLYDLDGHLVSSNPMFRELGLDQTLANLDHLPAGELEMADWLPRLAKLGQIKFEATLATVGGTGVYRCELRRVESLDGEPRAMLTLQNQSEQRIELAELALSESRARSEHFFDRAGIVTYVWNVKEGVSSVDRRWRAMFGYDPEELSMPVSVWKLFQTMLHPDDAPRMLAELARMQTGTLDVWDHEYRLRGKDGAWRWVLDRGTVTSRDEFGHAAEITGVGLNITEKKRVEEALAQSEMRQRALLGAIPDLIVIHDREGTFVDVHASRKEDWNLQIEKLVGRKACDVFSPALLAKFEGAQREVLCSGRAEDGVFEIQHHTRGTVYREYRMVAHGAGQTLTLVRDVTDRYRREAEGKLVLRQVQQAQKMEALGQLTGGIAHDFNNILASILGYAWMARQHPRIRADAKASGYLEIITTAGERGRDLVQKLMTFSRRNEPRELQAIDPLPVVAEAFNLLKSVIPSRINLQLDLPALAPWVAIDPVELHQVLLNLVVNSRDALPAHGDIVVSLETTDAGDRTCSSCLGTADASQIRIKVRDTGSGIPPHALDRIFDPFFSTKDVGEGTGIGLSVVDGIVHRAGGHVLVESRAGVGTWFEILLPPHVPGAAAALAPGRLLPSSPALSGKLMVVDDEPWVGGFLRELLESLGYSVDLFSNGVEALAALGASDSPYLAIITDLTMPHMTGLEFASTATLRYPGLPVLLCTGASVPPDADTLRRAGIHSVIPKPIPVDELRRILTRVIAG